MTPEMRLTGVEKLLRTLCGQWLLLLLLLLPTEAEWEPLQQRDNYRRNGPTFPLQRSSDGPLQPHPLHHPKSGHQVGSSWLLCCCYSFNCGLSGCDAVLFFMLWCADRYFVHVGGSRDVNLTLVVVPVDDHAHDCLKRGCNNAIQSSDVLRQAKYSSSIDAITLVEQQMTCGSCRTRINASSMSLGPSSAPAVVKVSFSDVTIVSDGQGLPPVKDGVKRGDMIVDQSSHGRPTLTVIMKDIKDFPALRLGQVTWGMDSLTCLVNTEDTKRGEFSRSSGFRAKIKATVMREEEAVYDVMFGMDL